MLYSQHYQHVNQKGKKHHQIDRWKQKGLMPVQWWLHVLEKPLFFFWACKTMRTFLLCLYGCMSIMNITLNFISKVENKRERERENKEKATSHWLMLPISTLSFYVCIWLFWKTSMYSFCHILRNQFPSLFSNNIAKILFSIFSFFSFLP